MKVSGRVMIFCAALILVLMSACAIEILDSFNDFDRSVPIHSLLLLHWFANRVTIDDYDDGISLNFNPDNGDYGSHYYCNYEGLLPPIYDRNTRYYTIGNIFQERGLRLPYHVAYPEYGGGNRARIIIRVRNQGGQALIDAVYITQHYGDNQGTDYDPDHTYLITTNLLRQAQQLSMYGDRY